MVTRLHRCFAAIGAGALIAAGCGSEAQKGSLPEAQQEEIRQKADQSGGDMSKLSPEDREALIKKYGPMGASKKLKEASGDAGKE
jgi:hypothetical protein